MAATKVCSRCRRELPVAAFYRNRTRSGGRSLYCKLCHDAQQRDWHRRKREEDPRAYRVRVKNYARRRYAEMVTPGLDWWLERSPETRIYALVPDDWQDEIDLKAGLVIERAGEGS